MHPSQTGNVFQRAVAARNELCGSNLLSAYEMAILFARPILSGAGSTVRTIPPEIVEAQKMLPAKRKLTRILRSKSKTDPALAIGDLVEMYVKRASEKQGKWSSPCVILTIDTSYWIVTVPTSHGRTMQHAFEDVRPALTT